MRYIVTARTVSFESDKELWADSIEDARTIARAKCEELNRKLPGAHGVVVNVRAAADGESCDSEIRSLAH